MSAPAIDTAAETFEYPVDIADAGPAAKVVTVTIPRDRIDAHTKIVFDEVRGDVALPGFRKGRAPKHVIQKRMGKAVHDQVQGDLFRESYQFALEKSDLNAVGEPEIENPSELKLPETGDFTYRFTVEVRPDFELPELKELTVKKAKITIKNEHVDQALENLRNQQGTLVPADDREVQEGDYLIADVKVSTGGESIASQEDAQIIARSGRIAGLEIKDFGEKVSGMKVGMDTIIHVTAPDDLPNENLRGKEVEIAIKIKDIKTLQPAEIDEPFLESLGFSNREELMEALREQMVERVDQDVQNAMRRQVQDFLLEKVTMSLPEKMSARQTDRVINRRAMDLLSRGVPQEKVRAAIDQLRRGADNEAQRELKTFFILDKAAADRNIELDEEEINGQIAMLAIDRGERPQNLKNRMEKDGSLANLFVATRERKTLDAMIEEAKIEEFEPSADETKQAVDEATGTGDPTADESEDVT